MYHNRYRSQPSTKKYFVAEKLQPGLVWPFLPPERLPPNVYRQNYYRSIFVFYRFQFEMYRRTDLMYCITPIYYQDCLINIYLKLLRPLFPRSSAGNRRRNVKCCAVAPILSELGVAHRPRCGGARFCPFFTVRMAKR